MGTASAPWPATILACPDPPWNNRVYYVSGGCRHWVMTARHLLDYGRSLAEVEQVRAEEIRGYANAGPLPRRWDTDVWTHPCQGDPQTMREIATSRLEGRGIEFGAGTNPTPLPLTCRVEFADFAPASALQKSAYPLQGADFVPLTYVLDIQELSPIGDSTLDFVVAAHVIEHLRNPIRALEQIYRKLAVGGQCVLVVPDQRRSFDRRRQLTTLRRLIADYRRPDLDADIEEYRDSLRATTSKVITRSRARRDILAGADCHFHTWTYESFLAMLAWSRENVVPWQIAWSHPPVIEMPPSEEFYVVLHKG